MKGPGREQVATCLLAAGILLVAAVSYATAAELQQRQQAEVNGSRGQRVRFGERTASITRLSDGYLQGEGSGGVDASGEEKPSRRHRGPTPRSSDESDISLEAPAKEVRISRRYDAHKMSPPAAQLVHEIPIVQKSRASSNSPGSQRGQTRSRDDLRHRAPTPSYSSSVSATVSTQQQQQQQPSSSSSSQRSVLQQQQSRNSNLNRSRSSPPSRSTSASSQPSDRDIVGSRLGEGSLPSSSHRSGAAAAAKTKTTGITAAATTSAATTTTSTATTRPFFPRNFSLSNAFDWLPHNLFNFSAPPAATTPVASATKKPPKKYKPSPTPAVAQGEEKTNYQKTQPPPKAAKDDGPFRIALPTINFFNPPTAASAAKESAASSSKLDKGKRATAQPLRERFNCPRESEVRFQLFPKICKTDKDCSIWNRDELCCEIFGAKSCVSGMPKPLEESSHMPILGLIPRKCPTRPLAELWWDVQECDTDNDCWPRVCCPDGRRRYCRTSQPELEVVPVPVKRSFNYLTEYLECTAPPPPIFDLHPKACTSTFDCFPNVCCQEAGLRHCRPPKKSLLTLMANFLNVDFVKRLTQNIVIK